jgi:hypothetical protein
VTNTCSGRSLDGARGALPIAAACCIVLFSLGCRENHPKVYVVNSSGQAIVVELKHGAPSTVSKPIPAKTCQVAFSSFSPQGVGDVTFKDATTGKVLAVKQLTTEAFFTRLASPDVFVLEYPPLSP